MSVRLLLAKLLSKKMDEDSGLLSLVNFFRKVLKHMQNFTCMNRLINTKVICVPN